MTKEELIEEFNKKKILAQGRFEAYDKIIKQTQRLNESSMRKGNESHKEVERHKTPQASDRRLYDRSLYNYALCNGYSEILNVLLRSYNQCKEDFFKDLQEIDKQIEELKKAQQNDGATIIDEEIHDHRR